MVAATTMAGAAAAPPGTSEKVSAWGKRTAAGPPPWGQARPHEQAAVVPPSATEETGWELPRNPLYKNKVQTSAMDRSSAGTGDTETSPGGEGSGEPRRESEMEAVLLAAMDAPPPPKGKAGPAGGQAGMAPPLFDMLDLTDATPPARQGRSPSPHPRAGGDVGTVGPVRQQLAATTTMTRSTSKKGLLMVKPSSSWTAQRSGVVAACRP